MDVDFGVQHRHTVNLELWPVRVVTKKPETQNFEALSAMLSIAHTR